MTISTLPQLRAELANLILTAYLTERQLARAPDNPHLQAHLDALHRELELVAEKLATRSAAHDRITRQGITISLLIVDQPLIET